MIPLLLTILVALMLGLIAYGFWRSRRRETGDMPITSRDDVLVGFVVLAILALAIFLSYALLGLH
jgi:hypothetical protein